MKESEFAMKQATAKIGQLYSRLLPEGWTNFLLHMYVPSKASEEYFSFYSMDDGITWRDLSEDISSNDDRLMDLLDAQDAVKELYELCAFEDDLWTEMHYTLTNSGKFTCDFDYQKLEFVAMDQRKRWHGMTQKA